SALLTLLVFVAPIFADESAAQKPTGPGDNAGLFAQLDTNKDGQLTSDEVPEDKKRLFERLLRVADKNGDGKLTSDEFTSGLQEPQRKAPEDAPRRPEGRPEGRPDPQRFFKRLDTNGDGKVTADEAPEERREFVKRLIARLDKDG